ncbi:hydroxypyruvate isomerase family protein [Azorhizobium doebereinerae]|uniref:hydroxypyruvate isomerase family protein n=1 Tax=Azorhizobium doebereinerae TaxID=281091 RepID=UPI000429DEE2|nr:TIM barrel protein [Azorhizobium doebereinerae]
MPRFAANLHCLFREWSFLDRFAAAADAGFTAVEFDFPYDVRPDRVAERLQRHGLQPVMLHLPAGDWAAGDRGLAALSCRYGELKASVEEGLAYAKAIGAGKVVMMAGLAALDDPAAVASFRRAVRHAAERLGQENIGLLLKPLDPREIPGYFLTNFCYTASFVAAAGQPNVKMLFDIYQRQLASGDVAMALGRHVKHVGHVQVAAVPDRGEPDGEGELSFPFLFCKLERLGFKGFVGCNYHPRGGSTGAGLGWFRPYATQIRASA